MGFRFIRVSTQSINELLDSLCLVMNCQQPFTIEHNDKDYIVPCGKCLVCLQKRRNDWVFRLSQEHKRSKCSAFITLTYSPRFYPEQNGLQKRDFQLFMKRLRRNNPDKKLRYYAVGEYGSKRQRAHYHALLFNWDGDARALSKAWSVNVNGVATPLGIVHIGRVTQSSIRYCTKYVIQRGYLPHSPDGRKLNPPFALMSRQYGLGLWYLTDAVVSWHRSGYKNYVVVDGEKQALPRYYKKFIFHEEEVREYMSKKAKRESEAAHQANVEFLKSEGYDPDKIIAEMREAVLSRVKEKIAYTQTF